MILAALAALTPPPSYLTDRDIYERIARDFIIPDCSSLHCTRVLVPWLLGRVPGPPLVVWKLYAVVCNLVAAAGVARLTRVFGGSAAASRIAAAMTALGGGAQLTLFDPHSADPLIYAIVPWVFDALLGGRLVLAAAAGAAGTLAKEFAAAPSWIFVLAAILAGRMDRAVSGFAAAATATAAWLLLQLTFILGHNYSFGDSPSTHLLAGGDFVGWISELGVIRAVVTLVLRFGPLAALVWAAFSRAPRLLRTVALASIPAAIAFDYVQQPDRALWNFAFVLIPLVAPAIADAPPRIRWMFVSGYALSSVHLGVPQGQWVIVIGWCLATVAAVGIVRSAPVAHDSQHSPIEWPSRNRPTRAAWVAAAAASAIGAVLFAAAVEVALHRAAESETGYNIWGYRGPVLRQKLPTETRIAVLGDGVAYGDAVVGSMIQFLQDYVNNPLLQRNVSFSARGPLTVVNLATPCDGPDAFPQTLRDYRRLGIDAVALYLDGRDGCPGGWRRTSRVFQRTGYLPIVPPLRPSAAPAGAPVSDDEYVAALASAVEAALDQHVRVIVAIHPLTAPGVARRLAAVEAMVRGRFDGRVAFVDLHHDVDPSVASNAFIGEQLSQHVFRLLAR